MHRPLSHEMSSLGAEREEVRGVVACHRAGGCQRGGGLGGA